MDEQASEQVIVASRAVSLITGAAALAGIFLGIWALFLPPGLGLHAAGWVAIFFGASSLPVLLAHLVHPARLRLREDAMVIDTALSKPKIVRWSDVEGFYVWKVPSAKLPAFRYNDEHGPDGALGRAMRRRAGFDAALASVWPLDSEVLVNVLNRYRAHYGT